MVTIDLDLHLHNAIRLLMREEGKSADQAFDAALQLLFTALAEEGDHSLELEIHRQALLYLREEILTPYRQPQPDLSDLTPLIRQKNAEAATRQRERRKRRQLGGRP